MICSEKRQPKKNEDLKSGPEIGRGRGMTPRGRNLGGAELAAIKHVTMMDH